MAQRKRVQTVILRLTGDSCLGSRLSIGFLGASATCYVPAVQARREQNLEIIPSIGQRTPYRNQRVRDQDRPNPWRRRDFIVSFRHISAEPSSIVHRAGGE
jgi:hypothetical protein